MDKNLNAAVMLQLENVKSELEKNNMNAFIAQSKEDACTIAVSLMKEGAVVASGGSMSLAECGMMDILRSGKYEYLDREKVEDKIALYRKSFCADYYLCSSNAVTEKGELYNVDGNGNRVACIAYGPEKIIMIVGRNKIVKDLQEAQSRVKRYAAPANCQRLSCKTYCHEKGVCMGEGGSMTDGCLSDGRICSQYIVSGYQRLKGRINVILVNEELGY